ncbi:MAG: hypothetical protein ABI581_14890 [Sediminibacterium sp.]
MSFIPKLPALSIVLILLLFMGSDSVAQTSDRYGDTMIINQMKAFVKPEKLVTLIRKVDSLEKVINQREWQSRRMNEENEKWYRAMAISSLLVNPKNLDTAFLKKDARRKGIELQYEDRGKIIIRYNQNDLHLLSDTLPEVVFPVLRQLMAENKLELQLFTSYPTTSGGLQVPEIVVPVVQYGSLQGSAMHTRFAEKYLAYLRTLFAQNHSLPSGLLKEYLTHERQNTNPSQPEQQADMRLRFILYLKDNVYDIVRRN